MNQYGDSDTLTQPVAASSKPVASAIPVASVEPVASTQRYEEARAAAHRAMTSVTLVPDKPLPSETPLGRDERPTYRGFKYGAAFFGWLIMLSMIVLLTLVVTGLGVGASSVLDYTRADAKEQAAASAITAAAVFVLVLSLAFYIGGYVAGRLARFDGARQGFGVWMISLLLVMLAAAAGAFLNSQYDLASRVDRPDVPLTNDFLLTGGLITAAAVLMLPLLAALLGGKDGSALPRQDRRSARLTHVRPGPGVLGVARRGRLVRRADMERTAVQEPVAAVPDFQQEEERRATHRADVQTSSAAEVDPAYRGFKSGAAFFGWLIAVGLTVLITGIIVAVAAAVD